MTVTIPIWVYWVGGGVIGLVILVVLLFFAYIGWICSKAFKDCKWSW